MELNYIEQWLPEASVKYDDGSPAINLGLIITVFFKDGHTQSIRNKMAECADRYYSEFHSRLKKIQLYRWHRITANNYNKKRTELIEMTEEQKFAWHLTGAKELAHAPDYDLFMMNQRIFHNEAGRTIIKLTFPFEFLREPEGLKRYEEWVLWLCNSFRVESGYAGLAFVPPLGFLETEDIFPWEYVRAKRFPGVIVDSCSHFEGGLAVEGIKSACWYTILGHSWLQKLTGGNNLQSKLINSGSIEQLHYNGGLILKTGRLPPPLGEVSCEELPLGLVRVNSIIKPIRFNKPYSLHAYAPKKYAQFDEETSMKWFSRFDEANIELD
ncbi:DUF3396 domain-containing protein [Edwardsiella tarda]|uniref:type VI immunity family protein n=1 Tax=Edwardsiella tarda TaxID=636 RepID=UPI0015E7EBE1|nr:type VI immunity family protein [Edwardsiella tarda]UCQ27461.1 DUF3396 domain-containing protein [Edwardsiella tarda]